MSRFVELDSAGVCAVFPACEENVSDCSESTDEEVDESTLSVNESKVTASEETEQWD